MQALCHNSRDHVHETRLCSANHTAKRPARVHCTARAAFIQSCVWLSSEPDINALRLKRLFTVHTANEDSSRTAHFCSSCHQGCDEIVHPSIQHACTVQTFNISMAGYIVTMHTQCPVYLWVCMLHPALCKCGVKQYQVM